MSQSGGEERVSPAGSVHRLRQTKNKKVSNKRLSNFFVAAQEYESLASDDPRNSDQKSAEYVRRLS